MSLIALVSLIISLNTDHVFSVLIINDSPEINRNGIMILSGLCSDNSCNQAETCIELVF